MSSQYVRAAATAAGAALLVVAGAPSRAQGQATETGVVRGRVVEAGSQRPIGDAQVLVVGTTAGTITNAAGEYVLPRVPAGARTIRVRRIGFGAADRAVTVAAGQDARADVTLSAAASTLEQVVVTGTGVATTRRTLGNSITQLDAAEVTAKSTLANVTDLLQSKTPGVQLIPGSGTAGTSADIRIRGTSSLAGSNRPLFLIDGIRMYDGPGGAIGPSGTGATGNAFAQGTSALDAINPEDIESVEVIKGPAAATLYGAEAAGGVVQIITKKGARNQGRVNWNGRADVGGSQWAVERLTNYTTCTQARVDARIASGLDSGTAAWPGCQGVPVNSVITGSPLDDDPAALRTGQYRNYALSARGGGDRYNFFASGDFNRNQGVLRNNADERANGRLNFGYTLSQQLDLQLNTSYLRRRQSLPLGDDAGGALIISATRGQPGAAAYNGQSRVNTRGWRINLPEVANQYDNRVDTDRFVTGGTVNWRPAGWLRSRLTAGIDYNNPLATVFFDPADQFSQSDFPNGYIQQQSQPTRVFTFDFAATASNTLGRGFTSELTAGAQGIRNRQRTLNATGTGLPSGAFQLLQAATTVGATSNFYAQASLGYYVQEQVGWNNRLFLTGAVRADDNSAFGSDFNRVLYPKASLSYVVSEEPALRGLFGRARVDNFKLRYAYGQAGRAPGPYDALRTYNATRAVTGSNSVVSGLITQSPGNADLRPERGTENEFGFDAGFLGGRLGAEFTYYKKTVSDALVGLANAPSEGYTALRYLNFGRIANAGTELSLRGAPVQRRSVAWDVAATYSTNRNKLVRFNQTGAGGAEVDRTIAPFNPYLSGAFQTQLIKQGYPIAGFWAVDARRNDDGTFAKDTRGNLVFDTATVNGLAQASRYVGPPLPTYEGSVSNTVTLFRNLRLYALVDFKGGNYIFNQKERNRNQTANRNSALFNPTDPARRLSADDSTYIVSNATARWIEPADFVKLRDVSVSYTLPPRFTRGFGRGFARADAVTLTVAANNVAILSKRYSGPDPEVNFLGNATFITGTYNNANSNFINFVRTDSYTLPMSRRVTAGVNVAF